MPAHSRVGFIHIFFCPFIYHVLFCLAIVFNYNQISLVSLVLALTFIIIIVLVIIVIILFIEFILLLIIIVSIIIFVITDHYYTAFPRQPPRQEVAPGATER